MASTCINIIEPLALSVRMFGNVYLIPVKDATYNTFDKDAHATRVLRKQEEIRPLVKSTVATRRLLI